jgi:hypothetical protein
MVRVRRAGDKPRAANAARSAAMDTPRERRPPRSQDGGSQAPLSASSLGPRMLLPPQPKRRKRWWPGLLNTIMCCVEGSRGMRPSAMSETCSGLRLPQIASMVSGSGMLLPPALEEANAQFSLQISAQRTDGARWWSGPFETVRSVSVCCGREGCRGMHAAWECVRGRRVRCVCRKACFPKHGMCSRVHVLPYS